MGERLVSRRYPYRPRKFYAVVTGPFLPNGDFGARVVLADELVEWFMPDREAVISRQHVHPADLDKVQLETVLVITKRRDHDGKWRVRQPRVRTHGRQKRANRQARKRAAAFVALIKE